MAKVQGNQVVLDDGSVITPEQGGWYDGQQYWGGTLSASGVINSLSNQVGAGQAVSDEVNRASSVAQGKAPDAISNYLKTKNKQPMDVVQSSYVPGLGTSGAGIPNTNAGGSVIQAPTTIDLVSLYDNLYKDLGISEKEQQIKDAEKNFLEARNKISNNPFLSTSSSDKRLARIRQQYEYETNPIRTEIATKKADIETRLALETQQFDINSQSAQQALSQFNTLLDMGALNGASGEDIASITRATGLSSQAIQSAINSKIRSGYNTFTESFDDGTDQGFILYTIDEAGNVISQNRQVVAPSAKKIAQASGVSGFLNQFQSQSSGSGLSDLWGM